MLPHPTTMPFAWEDEVQRCTRILVFAFVVGVFALFGGMVMVDHARGSSPAVAERAAFAAVLQAPTLGSAR